MSFVRSVVFLHGLGEGPGVWDAQHAALPKDRPNLPAARQLVRGIRDAQLHIIPGAGHQSYVQAPEEFSRALGVFLGGVGVSGK